MRPLLNVSMSWPELERRLRFETRSKAVELARTKVIEAARLVADPTAAVFSDDGGHRALAIALAKYDATLELLAELTGGKPC